MTTQAQSQTSFAQFDESFQLPSHGIPYVDDGGGPLIADEEGAVRIRMMTGAEEAIVNSPGMNDQAKIAKILEACTQITTTNGQPFHPKRLITTDRLMLLLAIRVRSLGAKYKLVVEDSNGNQFDHHVDLVRDLTVDEMPRMVLGASGQYEERRYDPIEGIPCTLPVSQQELRLRLLTGADEDFLIREAMNKRSKLIPRQMPGDPSYYLRIFLSIRAWGEREVNHSDPRDTTEIAQMISQLPIRDTSHINTVYGEYDVGIDPVITATSPVTGEEVEAALRLTPDFFRIENS
jgi:hypothetical protein